MGSNVGYTNTHYGVSDYTSMTVASVSNTGLGVRPFAGYAFTQNWSLEAGYTRFANTTFENIQLAPGNTISSTNTLVNGNVNQSSWDMVVKGALPFENGFGVYAKGGGAYVSARNDNGLSVYSNVNKMRPVYGLGSTYDFNANVTADIDWSHIAKGSGIENADLVSAGLGYYFG